jgi:hypothetical protein
VKICYLSDDFPVFMNKNNTKTTRFCCAAFLIVGVGVLLLSGCGVTKWSDTARTGTEQLLISNAIDTAVSKINFRPMGDKKTFVDVSAIDGAIDHKYLAKAIRQHLAANGGILCDEKSNADYVLEVRSGGIGTDRSDLLLVGVPAMTIPGVPGMEVTGMSLPEIPVVKRTKQVGVAKIAVFAYNQHTGRPLWASGNTEEKSTANQLWIAGAGPLTRGTIYNEMTFADHKLPEFMLSEKDRKQMSFADSSKYFKEYKNDPALKHTDGNEMLAEKTPPPAVQPLVPPVLPPNVPMIAVQPSPLLPTPPQPSPAPVQPQVADPWKIY